MITKYHYPIFLFVFRDTFWTSGLLSCLAYGSSFKRGIFGKIYSSLIVVLVMEEVPQTEKLDEYAPPFLAVPSL